MDHPRPPRSSAPVTAARARIVALTLALGLAGCSNGGDSGGPLRLGFTGNGTIGERSATSAVPTRDAASAYRRDVWTIPLEAGTTVAILMCRTGTVSFDPFVAVHGPGGLTDHAAADDDGGGDVNSRLVYTATSSGTHTIFATTLAAFAPGSSPVTYAITVYDAGTAPAACPTG